MYELELKRKRYFTDTTATPIVNATAAMKYITPLYPEEDSFREKCYALFVDHTKSLIGIFLVGVGGADSVTMDIKLICSAAVMALAQGVIICHNHPCENTKPSVQDIKNTDTLKKALLTLDIELLDHIIIAGSRYYSFKDEIERAFIPMKPNNPFAAARETENKMKKTKAEYQAVLLNLISEFIVRHSTTGCINIEEFFHVEGNTPIYVFQNDKRNEYPSYYGECLETMTLTSPYSDNRIMLNNEEAWLFDAQNETIGGAILDMIEKIEGDIAAGKAHFTQDPYPGTLEYI